MLKGKGAINECPNCGSTDISAYDQDQLFGNEMTQKVDCNKCGKTFIEIWKAVRWEEEA